MSSVPYRRWHWVRRWIFSKPYPSGRRPVTVRVMIRVRIKIRSKVRVRVRVRVTIQVRIGVRVDSKAGDMVQVRESQK